MPRRHSRDEHVPLNITPADIPRPRREKTPAQVARERRAREDRDWERRRAEQKRELAAAINWLRCLVPKCDGKIMNPATVTRDPDRHLPLCTWHEIQVWQTVQARSGDPVVIQTAEHRAAILRAEAEQREEEERKRFLARQDGQIYFLRLNGLIKAGWSRDLHERLRAYGPDVEVLCHYAGTRQDETNLHRNLTPFRAKGREWYHDCVGMRDIISKALEQHGEPYIEAVWTVPTELPVRARKGSRSKPTGLSL